MQLHAALTLNNRNKLVKNLLPLLVLTAISSNSIAAEDPNISVGLGYDQDLSVIFDLNSTFRMTAGNDGMAMDYVFKRGDIESETDINWFLGAGGYYEWDDDFGARLPLGVEVHFADKWEIYAQVHPELGISDGLDFGVGASFGVTYSFK